MKPVVIPTQELRSLAENATVLYPILLPKSAATDEPRLQNFHVILHGKGDNISADVVSR